MVSRSQKGFTIVELMISIMIMSITMLLVTMGVIQVSRYYKLAQTKTELLNANRELHAQFMQDLQYTGYDPDITTVVQGGITYNVICLGTTRYIWQDTSFTSNTFAVEQIAGAGACSSLPLDLSKSPLPPETRVTDFTLGKTGSIWTLDSRFVLANSEDLFPTSPANSYRTGSCISVSIGGQYCAVTTLKSTIVRKVAN